MRSYTKHEDSGNSSGGKEGWNIWGMEIMLKPVVKRFKFHFEGKRPTNKIDKVCDE